MLGASDDVNALSRRDVVGDPVGAWLAGGLIQSSEEGWGDVLGGVDSVVHEEKLDLVGVADEESLEASGVHETGLLVGTVANLELQVSAPPSHLSVGSRSLRLLGRSTE